MDGDARDELEAAKSGLAIDEAPSAAPRSAAKTPTKRGFSPALVIIPLVLAAIVGVLLMNEQPFVYSQTVDEVMASPAAFDGRTLRVEGLLTSGSIQFREDPCEWRFTLEREGHSMPVQFPECVVPDTFRDGMGITVVVEGELHSDGVFHATEVIPRCPSRYEMDERQRQGETMPHAPTQTSAVSVPTPPT